MKKVPGKIEKRIKNAVTLESKEETFKKLIGGDKIVGCIYETNDYSKFVSDPFNRGAINLKRLLNIMKAYPFHMAHPLHVYIDDNKLTIKDGNNRFETAKILKKSVKYVVVDKENDIPISLLNSGSTPWEIKNYLDCYCALGLKDYIYLRDYCKETSVSISAALAMFEGVAINSRTSNATLYFKAGTYKIKTTDHALLVKRIILEMKKANLAYATNRKIVAAISKVCFVDNFDPDRLITNIWRYGNKFKFQTSAQYALDLIQDLYNADKKENDETIFLRTMAENKAKQRGSGTKISKI